MNLLDYIPTGAENAIDTKTLLQDSGLRSVRALRKEIHRLRERGAYHLRQHRPADGVLHSGGPAGGGAVRSEHGEPPPGDRQGHQGGKEVYRRGGGTA